MKKTVFHLHIAALCIALLFLLSAFGCTLAPSASDGSDASLTLEVFSVGKADAILLTFDGYAVLIDAGEQDDGADIVNDLKKRGIDALDLLILTHFDKDHIGGADAVLNAITVKSVRLPNYKSASDEYAALVAALENSSAEELRMTENASFSLGGADFVMWVSDVAYDGDNDNEQSLVFKVVYGGKTYLFMGDAEGKWLKHLCYGTYNLTCDVLKLPHHGREDKNTLALLTVSMPSVALITDSEKNPADDEVLTLLEDFGVLTYRTATGSIQLVQSGGTLTAEYTQ